VVSYDVNVNEIPYCCVDAVSRAQAPRTNGCVLKVGPKLILNKGSVEHSDNVYVPFPEQKIMNAHTHMSAGMQS